MKTAGFILLVAGWLLVLAALAMLPKGGARAGFVLAGLGVEMAGLVEVARAHMTPGDRQSR